jgi:hypothetical protein
MVIGTMEYLNLDKKHQYNLIDLLKGYGGVSIRISE